jgi:hypothetical protein
MGIVKKSVEDEFYYIVDGVISNPHTLPVGLRVLVFPISMIRLPNNAILEFEHGEGPYESIKQLKKHSELYRALLLTDPKRAIKIFEDRFVERVERSIMYAPKGNKDFEKQIYKILLHTYKGIVSKKDVSGVHYYNADYVKVIERLGFDGQSGVQIAMIEVRKSKSNKWVTKRQPTTFFPLNWSMTRVIAECEHAFLNRVKTSETKYKGITKSGVLVTFIFDYAGNLKTVYPICEELE